MCCPCMRYDPLIFMEQITPLGRGQQLPRAPSTMQTSRADCSTWGLMTVACLCGFIGGLACPDPGARGLLCSSMACPLVPRATPQLSGSPARGGTQRFPCQARRPLPPQSRALHSSPGLPAPICIGPFWFLGRHPRSHLWLRASRSLGLERSFPSFDAWLFLSSRVSWEGPLLRTEQMQSPSHKKNFCVNYLFSSQYLSQFEFR